MLNTKNTENKKLLVDQISVPILGPCHVCKGVGTLRTDWLGITQPPDVMDADAEERAGCWMCHGKGVEKGYISLRDYHALLRHLDDEG